MSDYGRRGGEPSRPIFGDVPQFGDRAQFEVTAGAATGMVMPMWTTDELWRTRCRVCGEVPQLGDDGRYRIVHKHAVHNPMFGGPVIPVAADVRREGESGVSGQWWNQ